MHNTYSDWQTWFAWRPVHTLDHRWKWLTKINRRYRYHPDEFPYVETEYVETIMTKNEAITTIARHMLHTAASTATYNLTNDDYPNLNAHDFNQAWEYTQLAVADLPHPTDSELNQAIALLNANAMTEK